MKTSFLSLVALLACVAGSAAAQPVKKYVTPEGKVIYSDQPVPGARIGPSSFRPAGGVPVLLGYRFLQGKW